jgi:hypothetical protein
MIVGISSNVEADIADGYWFYERQCIPWTLRAKGMSRDKSDGLTEAGVGASNHWLRAAQSMLLNVG